MAGWRTARRRLGWAVLVTFIGLNLIAWLHAWHFTHFAAAGARTGVPTTAWGRARLLLTGVTLPRPRGSQRPAAYRALRIRLPHGEWLGAWTAPAASGACRGTVLLFHGYGGQKSTLLPEAEAFRTLGYRVLLLDFRGGGESSGADVTIGYREAADVRAAWQHVGRYWHEPPARRVLFGVSMGAAACLRALAVYGLRPRAVVLESTFGSTYQTVVNRFRILHAPPVPLAALLAFWGGAQHGYWAFSHNPQDYAQAVRVPTLLLTGAQDPRVTVAEVEAIRAHLRGPRRLVIVPNGGHGQYLASHPATWRAEIAAWLERSGFPVAGRRQSGKFALR